MLNKDKKQQLDKFVSSLSKVDIAWASGYLAGLAGDDSEPAIQANLPGDLLILYITETGNTKFMATEISKRVKASGSKVKIKSADQYRLTDLVKEKNVIIIASTHGEGEMPQSGKKFFDHINQNDLDFSKLNFFVIALGDTNYTQYCQAGKDIDFRLESLKANRKIARIDLDLDFEDHIDNVFAQIVNGFGDGSSKIEVKKVKSGKSEYIGEIASNVNLNDVDSTKETRHIEIVSDDEIDYEPGDSIGILFDNEELGVEGKIDPRLYSIASSVNEHGNEVHLTVSVVRYVNENGEQVEGLFSGRLAKLKDGDKVKFYVSKNRLFKLPETDKDIIMVGPGTGIAPFRAFLAERNYQDAKGKNWLFFGERNFISDFLYQVEWQDYLESGLLNKLDVAFSRDQEEKVYVQDKIRQNSKEFFEWLENGAYFYICGDKEHMAQDVEDSIIDVIKKEGDKNEEEAKEYLGNLIENDRYLKDVY